MKSTPFLSMSRMCKCALLTIAACIAGILVQQAQAATYTESILFGDQQFGTVFKVDPNGNETVLHSFTGSEGNEPVSNLVRDSAGNLYGTTNFGGPAGHGGVFKLTRQGVCTFLHYFIGGADGANPYAGLTLDAQGNLYGTTTFGGAQNKGVVFKVTPNGGETVVHSFGAGTDGATPYAA